MVLEEASTVCPPEQTGTSAKEESPSSKHSSQPELDDAAANGHEDAHPVREEQLVTVMMSVPGP